MGNILAFFFPHPFGAPRTARSAPAPRRPTIVLLLSGRRGAGKDTAAELLLEHNFPGGVGERLALADAVRREYVALHPEVTMEDLTDRARKEAHRPGIIALAQGRRREHGTDYWCRQLPIATRLGEGEAPRGHVYVVSDWRFAEECAYFRGRGDLSVVTMRVEASQEAREARGIAYDPAIDESHGERGLDDFPFDHVVRNDTQSRADLVEALRNINVRILKGGGDQ